jgi:hypothetical protein
MTMLTLTYDGDDLVIRRDQIEALGVKPGEKVALRPMVTLEPRPFSTEELERRRAILAELWGSWSADDELAFRRNRESWASWQPRS